MQEIPQPTTGDLSSLRSFAEALQRKQKEIGCFAAMLYGDSAHEVICVEFLSGLIPFVDPQNGQAKEFLRVTVRRISDGETAGGYLFNSNGGIASIAHPGCADGETAGVKCIPTWEDLSRRILYDIATVCAEPLTAIAGLAVLGAAIVAEAKPVEDGETASDADEGVDARAA